MKMYCAIFASFIPLHSLYIQFLYTCIYIDTFMYVCVCVCVCQVHINFDTGTIFII